MIVIMIIMNLKSVIMMMNDESSLIMMEWIGNIEGSSQIVISTIV